ncbi:LpqB family beta-propeller domain-containing protein [Sinosporangium album]|nr:LpqB family beta-propeller domain-containing protein [Sinosporangium album]
MTRTAAAVATLVVSSACAIVPTGGIPESVSEVNKGDPLMQPFTRLIPTPPRDDWDPEAVVRGFQAAMASNDDQGRAVARQYLTKEAARVWRSEDGVSVVASADFESAPFSEDAKETRVTLKSAKRAIIDDDGRYRTVKGESSWTATLVKVGKVWRIASVPNGLIITEADVQRAYRPVNLYFLDQVGRGLVVDQVRLPVAPDGDFAKTVVQRLLQGPSGSLKDAAITALPDHVRVNSVTTMGDTVVVDLSEQVRGGDPLYAQLQWTLHDLAKDWTIELRANGEPFSGAGLRIAPNDFADFDRLLHPGTDIAGYYLHDGALHMLGSDGNGTPVAGPVWYGGAGRKQLLYTEPALSMDQEPRVAAKSSQGGIWVTSLVEGGRWQQWIAGSDLTAPSWDRYSALWAVDRVGEATSHVLRHDGGRTRRIQAPGLLHTTVKAFQVARDGVRVAAVVEDSTGVHVRLGAIVGQGDDIRVDHLQTLTDAKPGEILDIAWKDSTTLLVLLKTKAGKRLDAYSVGDGGRTQLKADERLHTIAALGDRMLAGTEKHGGILRFDAGKSEWITVAKQGAGFPVFPLG